MKFKKIIPLLCFGFIFTSCGGGEQTSSSPNDSSNLSEVESSFESSESSETVVPAYSLAQAITNTRYYGLKVNSEGAIYYTEIYKEDFYYLAFSSAGYVVLDEDPNYLHYFDQVVTKGEGYDEYYQQMYVKGRNALKEQITNFEESNIISIIKENETVLKEREKNLYRSTDVTFIRAVADFMQQKGLRYCTSLELSIDENGRFSHLKMFEESITTKDMIIDLAFDDVDYKSLEMYTKWVEAGKTVEPRIADFKFLIEDNNKNVKSVYENETVSFSGVVSAIDVDGNYYVANENNRTGNIAIKVTSKNHQDIKLNDEVNVQGKVVSSNYLTNIVEATLEVTGSRKYAPMFDEERVVDTYGGGVYAYNYFCESPYYNDSIYTTYCYLSDAPTSYNSDADTLLEVVCPAFGQAFIMQVILPANLDSNVKAEIFEAMTTNGNFFYDEEPNEICLEKFIIEFDTTMSYAIKLIATNDSMAYKKLTPQEKINKYLGLENFPIIESETYTSFRFGEGTTYFLEDSYMIDKQGSSGVYIGAENITEEQFNDYITAIENYGANKYDEIRDYFGARHVIYQIGNDVIDISYSINSTLEEDIYVLNVWVYEGEIIRTSSIEERLDKNIGAWFDIDNFLRLDGTYDADYEIYELLNYAGIDYSDNPLTCVALDTQENKYNDYASALVKMGYSQYRGENNRPYSYKTRGQTHSVFTKDGVFVDIASYHTSDYTYTGHNNFEYRLEILIYKADAPISVTNYDSLDVLSNLYAAENPELAYSIDLPENSSVEIWNNLHDWKLAAVEYGYGYRDEAFVYGDDIEQIFIAIQTGLTNSGYKLVVARDNSTLFEKTIDGNSYPVLVMKESDKGYIRIMNDIGGVDFL